MDYQIRQKLIKLIFKSLGDSCKNIVITDSTKLIDDLGFDSSTIMDLIVALEEEFNFEFSINDNLIEIMNTIYSLKNYIESVIK